MSTRFEPGAPAGDDFVPLCVPEIRQGSNEWRYVKECLDTNFVSSVGTFVSRFEEQVAGAVGTKHAVATVNGTAALHIALLVAGVQPEDEVLVSTLTFVAPANAIRYAGAWPVFIDAEPRYWQMDPHKLGEFIERRCVWRDGALRNASNGRRVRAVLPVDILGHPVDYAPILEIARKYDLVIIEDATESLGALYRGRAVGTLGDISCLSFNGNKLITTGGGGMIVTDNARWAERSRYLTTQAKDDPLEYVHRAIGFNYRLTNMQAALGCAQIEHLDEYVAAKRRIAAAYAAALAESGGVTPMPRAEWADPTFWLYTILIDEEFGMDRRELLRYFEQRRIQTRPLWQPMHLSPAHAGAEATDCSCAESIHARALSLPSSVGLSKEQQDRVIIAIRNARESKQSVVTHSTK